MAYVCRPLYNTAADDILWPMFVGHYRINEQNTVKMNLPIIHKMKICSINLCVFVCYRGEDDQQTLAETDYL